MDSSDTKNKGFNWDKAEPSAMTAALWILFIRKARPEKNFDRLSLSHMTDSEFSSLSQLEISAMMMKKAKRILQTFPVMHIYEFEMLMEILDDDDIEAIRTSHLPITWTDPYGPERNPNYDQEND